MTHEHDWVRTMDDGILIDIACACGKRPLDVLDELPVPEEKQPYCPCGWTCHDTPSPCSLSCINHDNRGLR